MRRILLWVPRLRPLNAKLPKLRGLAYSLALVGLLAGAERLVAFWWEANPWSGGSSTQVDEAPRLDCFSRPAIAAAVLQREAERSFCECIAARDTLDLARTL